MKRDHRTGRLVGTPVADRLRSRITIDAGGCWIWQGYLKPNGYGLVKDSAQRTRLAHRLAYETFIGTIPEGLQLDHLCRVRACINPEHLEPVSAAENTHRGYGPAAIHGRKTHCIHGHPFDETNTYRDPTGKRCCRECGRLRARAYCARKRTRAT